MEFTEILLLWTSGIYRRPRIDNQHDRSNPIGDRASITNVTGQKPIGDQHAW